MKPPREIEIKLKVEHPRALKKRLRECGFGVVERRHFESNDIFDSPDSRMYRSRTLLRLRSEGKRHILTYKGLPHESDSYKIRTEIETEVQEAGALKAIFEALGFQPVFRYEKYRTAYAEKGRAKSTGRGIVVYDETPIGNYAELEGPGRWIDRTAKLLGFQKQDYITASYAALYLDFCQENGVQAGNMVFSRKNS